MLIRMNLLLFLAFPSPLIAASHNWTDTSKLMIHLPTDLYDPHGVPHVQGEFGAGPLDHSITARVYYVQKSLCHPLTNLTEGVPTTGSNRLSPHFLLAHGGSCSVVTKARHAQMAGASGIIIGEEHCTCEDEKCKEKYPGDNCTNHQNAMIDDGSGRDIFIPSILVFKPTFETMKDRLENQSQTMVMEILLKGETILDQGTKPSVHVWHLPHDPNVHFDTYLEMQRAILALGEFITFEPRLMLTDGEKFGCRNDNACIDLCSHGGRYCAFRRGDDVTSFHMVEEALRQLCIWNQTKDEKRYWEYLVFHKKSCVGEYYGDPKCIEDALKHSGLHRDSAKIHDCMTRQDMKDDIRNDLLKEALGHQHRSGVTGYPVLSVNHQIIPVHARDLLEAVCNEYWYSNAAQIPKICETCGACVNTVGCLEKGKCVDFSNSQRHPEASASSKSTPHRGWKAFWWLSGLSILACAAYYVYDKYGYLWQMRRSGVSRPSGLLNDYMHLQSDG